MKVIIGLLILGGLIIFGAMRGSLSTVTSKDAPKNLKAMVRGGNPYKSPSKPLVSSILGSIKTILLCILGIPKKIAAHFLPKKWKLLSTPIAVIVWLVFVLIFFW